MTTDTSASPLSAWLRGRKPVIMMSVLGVLTLLTAGLFVVYQRNALTAETLTHVELQARILEQQAEALLANGDNAVQTLDQMLGWIGPTRISENLLLTDALRNRQLLRSVHLIAATGRVLASSAAENTGINVDLKLFGALPVSDGITVVGPLLFGRDIGNLSRVEPQVDGASVLPLLRSRHLPDGSIVLIVQLVNLQSFASQFDPSTSNQQISFSLVSFDGTLLSATRNLVRKRGQNLYDLPVSLPHFSRNESISYVGQGIADNCALVSYRALRNWPLVVVAEISQEIISDRVRALAIATGGAALLVLLLLAGLSASGLRGLRRHEAILPKSDGTGQVTSNSRARIQAALDSLADGILTIDVAGNIVDFNPAAARMFGHSAVSARGRSLLELLIPSERRDALARDLGLAPAASAERVAVQIGRREITAQRANNERFLLEIAIVPINADDTVFYTCTLRDLTEVKRTENGRATLLDGYLKLTEELEVQKLALDEHAIVSIANAQGAITYANDKLRGISGFGRDELIGRSLEELRAHTLAPEEFARMQSNLSAGRIWQGETAHFRRDGGMYWTETTMVPLLAPDGGLRELITVQTDITERLLAERALRQSETRFRATFEQAAVGVLHQTLDRRFVRVNQTLCDLLGYSLDEFLKMDADLLVHPEDVGRGLILMKQLFDGSLSNFQQEKRYRHKQGHYVWTRLTASLVRDEEGQPQYMIAVIEDIRKYLQAQSDLAAVRDRELETGNKIQQALLVTPPDVTIPRLWISAFNQSSRGIDGDFFEVIRYGEDTVDVIVGDVMGKGIPAALMGAATKLQVSRSMAELLTSRHHSNELPAPSEIVTSVNRKMALHLQALDAFVTLAYLRVELQTNSVTWVGCGHEEPLLIAPGHGQRLLGNQHPPIGLFVDEVFRQETCMFCDGDAIFLSSDGATDAMLQSGERLGRDRLNLSVQNHLRTHVTPAMALHSVRHALLLEQVKVTDDLTMVLLLRPALPHNVARMEAPVSFVSLHAVRDFVAAQGLLSDLPEGVVATFVVAVIEVVTNVVRHGEGLVPGSPLELVAERGQGVLQVEVKYLGDRFDPPAHLPERDLATFPEGGFGLQIIYSACDSVDYLREESVNTVRMIVRAPA